VTKKKFFLLSLITHYSSLSLSGCALLGSACEEAGAAVDGATLRGIERDCGLLPALRTLHGDFDALAHTRRLRGGNRCEPFILGLLARLATLRLILQTFVVKEDLLASRPDEIISTVNAFDRAVFEFRFRMTPLPV
jgi:hypothetical protein